MRESMASGRRSCIAAAVWEGHRGCDTSNLWALGPRGLPNQLYSHMYADCMSHEKKDMYMPRVEVLSYATTDLQGHIVVIWVQ